MTFQCDEAPNLAMQRIAIWCWTPNGQAKDRYSELLDCDSHTARNHSVFAAVEICGPTFDHAAYASDALQRMYVH